MGYCMSMRAAKFHVSEALKAKALEAIKGTMKDESNMRGGSWTGGKQTERWYSWVSTKAVLAALTFEDAMREWGYPVSSNGMNNDDVDDISFEGEKIGQEDFLFRAIAPYVTDGSYIEMQGEDGALWRWLWARGEFHEQEAIISWESGPPKK